MIKAVIIDDETAVVGIIKYFIKQESLPIEICGTAVDGVLGASLIRREQPQLVFLDIQMPVMNGFELMKELPNYNYIIVTAYETFEYAQQALRLGAKDILLKPIDSKQLIESVNNAIGRRFTSNETVNGILQYIDEHYCEKITLADLSEHFFVTPSHIARLFKKHMDESVISYINRIRIEKARKLLKNGATIKEAASGTGFDSLNNFYKYFKIHTGTTPSSYVNNLK